ncbi:type II toxin-antitoxin system RelE family toxin [Geminocystis herdmanii]|uniref:type II toxin-antitoxin system RelE family toxin n=1 Tax=Geminocystis herdmanii TaxID=669359 RepID=UPI000344D91B|nr:type II toxin-antitoxin system RelE/ParE family toxin [Geminocystis herdmanii]
MWNVEYKRKFLKELVSLPQNVQSRIEIIVFKELEADNPFELGYINKMKGYKDKYKIRMGDYRIGLTINQKQKIIICERVAHRREIYQIFP